MCRGRRRSAIGLRRHKPRHAEGNGRDGDGAVLFAGPLCGIGAGSGSGDKGRYACRRTDLPHHRASVAKKFGAGGGVPDAGRAFPKNGSPGIPRICDPGAGLEYFRVTLARSSPLPHPATPRILPLKNSWGWPGGGVGWFRLYGKCSSPPSSQFPSGQNWGREADTLRYRAPRLRARIE